MFDIFHIPCSGCACAWCMGKRFMSNLSPSTAIFAANCVRLTQTGLQSGLRQNIVMGKTTHPTLTAQPVFATAAAHKNDIFFGFFLDQSLVSWQSPLAKRY